MAQYSKDTGPYGPVSLLYCSLMSGEKVPVVVVGVLVVRDGKVLLGKRKQGDGAAEYAGPGGRVRFGETLEECAARKVREETGLEVENVRILSFLSALHWEGAHYLDIEAVAEWKSGEPQVLEPDMFDRWDWYALDALPEPLIVGDRKGIEALTTGQVYFGTVRA